MIAALSLYDWPEIREETDAFWSALALRLRARGFDAPIGLDRDYRVVEDSPDLLFAQVCGLPYMRGVAPSAQLVATPCYDVAGCAGAAYSSAIIVRRGDARGVAALRGLVAANDDGSMSGWLSVIAEIGAPPRVFWSGAHRSSVIAVAEGRADAAAIDALAFDLARRFEPEAAAAVEVAGWTRRLPAPPYITAKAHDAAAIRAALEEVIGDPALAPALRTLRLGGVRRLREADYAPIQALADQYGGHLGPL